MTDHANDGDYGPPRSFSSLDLDAVSEGEVVLCGIVRFSPTGKWLHRGFSRQTKYVVTQYGVVYDVACVADFDGLSVKVVKDTVGFHAEVCPLSELRKIQSKRAVFLTQGRKFLTPESFLHASRLRKR